MTGLRPKFHHRNIAMVMTGLRPGSTGINLVIAYIFAFEIDFVLN
jgi:hypothetical protein